MVEEVEDADMELLLSDGEIPDDDPISAPMPIPDTDGYREPPAKDSDDETTATVHPPSPVSSILSSQQSVTPSVISIDKPPPSVKKVFDIVNKIKKRSKSRGKSSDHGSLCKRERPSTNGSIVSIASTPSTQRQSTGLSNTTDSDCEIVYSYTEEPAYAPRNLKMRINREHDLQRFVKEQLSMDKMNIHIDISSYQRVTDDGVYPELNQKKKELLENVDEYYNKVIELFAQQREKLKGEIIERFQTTSRQVFGKDGFINDIMKFHTASEDAIQLLT